MLSLGVVGVWLRCPSLVSARACGTREDLGSLTCKEGVRLNRQGGFSSYGRIPRPLFLGLQPKTLDHHGGSTVDPSGHWRPASLRP